MTLAPWRSLLSRALHRNRSDSSSRYLQLATVTHENVPANRTVVFRGFFDEWNALEIVADDRSEKIGQLERLPWAEVCWYFSKTREQFRLFGQMHLVGPNTEDETLRRERDRVWHDQSDSGRVLFVWPDPKAPRSQEGFDVEPPSAQAPPVENFYLLLLVPLSVDFLELRGDPQNRTLFSRQNDGTWTQKAVNP